MSTGRSHFDTRCKKCGGEIRKSVTFIRWAPAQKGSACHADCYFSNEIHTRDAYGKRADGVHQDIPDVPATEPSPELPIEVNVEKIQPDTPTPAVSPAPPEAGLMAIFAAGILPLIQDKINQKIDAAAVQKIAEDAVLACAGVLREEFTTCIIIDNKITGNTKQLEGLQHKQFKMLMTLVQTGVNTYLYDSQDKENPGGPGAGKSTAAAQVAEALGRKFGHISLNMQSQPSLIMGYMNATGNYVHTEFREVYENGGVFNFEELDNANGNFLTSLNTALSNHHCAFPDTVVMRHTDAVFIGNGNTPMRGASAMHSSRQQQDAASIERWVFIAWQYDEKLERKVALAYNADAESWVSWVQQVRKQVPRLGVKMVCSPRASIIGAQLLKTGEFELEQIADMVIFKGIDADTRSKVLANTPVPSFN